MHFTDVDEVGAGSGLDFDKNISTALTLPGVLPSWWGKEGAICGGAVAEICEGDTIRSVPVLCKRWGCEVCVKMRTAWFVRNVIWAIEAHDLTRLLTLTLNTAGRSAEQSEDDLKKAWNRLRGELKKRYGKFEFVWVREFTKKGYAHMHVLVSRWFPKNEISALWLKITGDSYVVDIGRVKEKGLVFYLAKYLAKQAGDQMRESGVVRWRHLFGMSRGVKFSKFMPGGKGWEVVKVAWNDHVKWLRQRGWIISERNSPTPMVVAAGAASTYWMGKNLGMTPRNVGWNSPWGT